MNASEGLWVETDGFGRCRLDGNAHTFPGRIGAWSETLETSVTISKSDVREASPEAWAWIDGFLAGNEPEFHEFAGIGALDDEPIEQDPAWQRYEHALTEFRSTGSMPFPLNRRPTLPPPPELSPEPWAAAGGEVLAWNGNAWVPLDPQPRIKFALLVGTVCEARGHHVVEMVGDQHLFCSDCGEITEGVVALA